MSESSATTIARWALWHAYEVFAESIWETYLPGLTLEQVDDVSFAMEELLPDDPSVDEYTAAFDRLLEQAKREETK